jgi:hypothetical protein
VRRTSGKSAVNGDLKKARERIFEISQRTRNVTVEEIIWVVNRLQQCGYETNIRGNDHPKIFRVNHGIFSVCTHKGGGKLYDEEN